MTTAATSSPLWKRKSVQALLLILITVAILFARSPDQFLHPYIWAEDGTIILDAYARRGLASIVEPVQGYYILATKLVSLTAFKLSIEYAPEIGMALTVAFICAVVGAIAFSPTHLPCRFLCAIGVLTVPVGPDVFGIQLDAFWWTGFLLVLALLWDDRRGCLPLRLGYVTLAGLSIPLIVPFVGLFALRSWMQRRRNDYIVLCLAAVLALIQVQALVRSGGAVRNPLLLDGKMILSSIDAFSGHMVLSERYGKWYSGPILLTLLAFACWPIRDRLNRYFVLLVAAWVAICATTYFRLPFPVDALTVGQRFFLHPFGLLTWIMIWIASLSPTYVRFLFGAAYVTGIALAFSKMSARHDSVDWRAHIVACAQSDKYDMPIHLTRRLDGLLHVELTGEQCRRMISESLLR
jgi:hypothetical protein